MDILIRGVEMPKSCDHCWALDDYGDYPRCRITEEQRGYNFHVREKRMDSCPLVPVPPHGRLADVDKLRELYEEWENDKEAGIDIDKCHVPIPVIRQNIDDAPTVIEASE